MCTNPLSRTRMLCLLLTLASPTLAAPPRADELVARANDLLNHGDFDAALKTYGDAAQLKPGAPQIAYNQAVAEFRKKRYARAAEAFHKALSLGDASLEAKTKFNLGNCSFAQALEVAPPATTPPPAAGAIYPLPGQPQPPPAGDPAKAVEHLKTAITYYGDSIAADPDDPDARANIELAHGLIKALQEQQKQQQQQQDSQKQDQSPQDEKKQDPQSQSSQPSSQPQQDPTQDPQQQDPQQSQQENQEGEQERQKEQPQSAESGEGGEEKQQERPSQAGDQRTNGELQSADSKEGPPPTGEARPVQMSRDEAERLLQIVRDKERQRRELKARKQRAGMVPVEKDW